MQEVEAEVNKNVEYETHKFSETLSLIDIDRIEHNYEKKITEAHLVHQAQIKHQQLKSAIRTQIQKSRSLLKVRDKEDIVVAA